jgi:hypothetical protein
VIVRSIMTDCTCNWTEDVDLELGRTSALVDFDDISLVLDNAEPRRHTRASLYHVSSALPSTLGYG